MQTIRDYVAPDNLLHDRVILVTGAGQGLGQMAATLYAAYGATVILCGRSQEKLEATYDRIVDGGHPEPIIFPIDFYRATDSDFMNMISAITINFSRLDGILHSASNIYQLTPLENQTLDEWQQMFSANVLGPFALTRACLPIMYKAPNAAILFTQEPHGLKASAYWGGFCASMYARNALMHVLADELSIHPNVRTANLLPGPVASPQRARTHPGEYRPSLPSMEDLAPLYLYLMSDAGKSRNGETLHMDSSTEDDPSN
ncbi:MAG TPA: SDR family NAD(P)-dependent oxidoreductase [Burkholderiales bacterium]|nr:SDR family NAD(P)-dependent oxidoreductase [Burkholderiales bacterium]